MARLDQAGRVGVREAVPRLGFRAVRDRPRATWRPVARDPASRPARSRPRRIADRDPPRHRARPLRVAGRPRDRRVPLGRPHARAHVRPRAGRASPRDPTGRYGRAVVVSGLAFAIVGLARVEPVLGAAHGQPRWSDGRSAPPSSWSRSPRPDCPIRRPRRADRHPASSILALTYAALTPGFSIAALILVAVEANLIVPARRDPRAMQPSDPHAVDFLVRATVAMLAGVAMHGWPRPPPRAPTGGAAGRAKGRHAPTSSRACSGSSASSTDRGPWPRSCRRSSRTWRPTFDVTLVSPTCPTRPGGSRWSGSPATTAPFHVIELGVGIIGRSGRDPRDAFVGRRARDPDYRAARRRRPQRGRGRRRSTAASCWGS